MFKPQGYAVITGGDGTVREQDTFTCAHCNTIVFVQPGHQTDIGGWCRMCSKNICGPCADAGKCTPFEKKLEAMERRDRMLRSAGVI